MQQLEFDFRKRMTLIWCKTDSRFVEKAMKWTKSYRNFLQKYDHKIRCFVRCCEKFTVTSQVTLILFLWRLWEVVYLRTFHAYARKDSGKSARISLFLGRDVSKQCNNDWGCYKTSSLMTFGRAWARDHQICWALELMAKILLLRRFLFYICFNSDACAYWTQLYDSCFSQKIA